MAVRNTAITPVKCLVGVLMAGVQHSLPTINSSISSFPSCQKDFPAAPVHTRTSSCFPPHGSNIMPYKWLCPTQRPSSLPQPASHMVVRRLKAFVSHAGPAQWISNPQRECRGGGWRSEGGVGVSDGKERGKADEIPHAGVEK